METTRGGAGGGQSGGLEWEVHVTKQHEHETLLACLSVHNTCICISQGRGNQELIQYKTGRITKYDQTLRIRIIIIERARMCILLLMFLLCWWLYYYFCYVHDKVFLNVHVCAWRPTCKQDGDSQGVYPLIEFWNESILRLILTSL